MKHLNARAFTVLLMACTLLFASCDGSTKPPETTLSTTSAAPTETTTEPTEQLGVPLKADYGGETFNILSAGNGAYADFAYEEESSLPLDNAQYKRTVLVEENYNINIEEYATKAYSSGNGPGFKQISTDVNAGECNYDVALIAGYDVSVLAYNGYLYDLNAIDGIDLSKSWWDQQANASLRINDVMFFTAGDFSIAENDAAMVIMFNKTLLKDYNLESPYDMVYNGEWTLENFAKLCKTVTEDLDNNDIMDEKDRYGLLVWVDSNLGMIHASGQRCATVNAKGEIELTLYNETTVNVVEKYLSFALDKQYALQYQAIHNTTAFEQELWGGNHGLFWTTYMASVSRFREMDSDFGLLPFPKYDSAQNNYHATVTPYFSQFVCVPLIQDDPERTGVITEALSYYGQQMVMPAYYDLNLKGIHSRDEESSDMLDIIFDSLVYDIGFMYQVGPYNKYLNYMVSRSETNFTSMYNSLLTAAESQLKQINANYQKAVSEWTK